MSKQQQPKERTDRFTDCNYFSDEDYPACDYRGTPCKFKRENRCKCEDYISVIHHQVICDVRQGTAFAQQMISDAMGEPIRSRPHPAPQAPECKALSEALVKELNDHWLIMQDINKKPMAKEFEKIIRTYMKFPNCPADCEIRDCNRCIAEGNAAIERKAREDVLDAIEEWRCTQDLTKGVLAFEIALGKKIESLRHSTQEARQ